MRRYLRAEAGINRKREQLRAIYDKAGLHAVDYSRDKVSASAKDTLSEVIAEAMDMETEAFKESLRELFQEQREVIDAIGSLENIDAADVLTAFYIRGRNIAEIADDFDRSLSWVYRRYHEGLKEINEYLGKSP